MRILQIGGLAGPGPIAGGVWAVAESQTQALRAQGHDVTLVGGWKDDTSPSEDFIPVRELFPGAGLRGLYAPGLEDFLARASRDVDLVHIHLSRDYLTTSSLRFLRDLPIVVQPHGMIGPSRSGLIRSFDLIYKQRYLTIPKRWLVLTDAEAGGLAKYGVSPEAMVPVDNAVEDPGEPVSARSRNAPPVFSFISRLQARKQPDVFVRAGIELLQETEAEFRLVGPDQGARAEAEEIAHSGPANSFTFIGPVDRAGVRAELDRTDVVVLPSRGEVAPMIAIEAAASGKALILTSDCGLAKTFAKADAALIVDPEVPSVAAAMHALAVDEAQRHSIGRAGRLLFEERWSLASLGQSLDGIYGQVVGEGA